MLSFMTLYNVMASSLTRKLRDDFLLTSVKEGDYSIKTINIKLLVFGSCIRLHFRYYVWNKVVFIMISPLFDSLYFQFNGIIIA